MTIVSRIWMFAAIVGALAASIVFGADVGTNALVTTGAAAIGVAMLARERGTLAPVAAPLGFALALGGSCSVTANGPYQAFAVALASALLGAATLVSATQPDKIAFNARFMLGAPFRALARSLVAIQIPVAAAARAMRLGRLSPRVRGALLAIPLALGFSLLFAEADPVFGAARDAFARLVKPWDFFPRVVFGVAVALFSAGALALSAGMEPLRAPARIQASVARTAIGITERIIVLHTVAGVAWLFVILQVGYLFRDAQGVAGSGISFAEYARRGFAEMGVAATIATSLIMLAHRGAREAPATSRALRVPSLVLVSAVGCILISAMRRVSLYESAYGYTLARVDAQTYMATILAGLAFLTAHLLTRFDAARLARQCALVALTTVTALGYWNDAAWVARRNLHRYAETGKVDALHLASLGDDAVPTLLAAIRLASIPCLELGVRNERGNDHGNEALLRASADRWFEWNASRAAARAARAEYERQVHALAPLSDSERVTLYGKCAAH